MDDSGIKIIGRIIARNCFCWITNQYTCIYITLTNLLLHLQMSGVRFGAIFQSMFSILLGLTIAIATHWRLGLVGAAFVPLVYIGARLQATVLTSQQWQERIFFEESAKVRTCVLCVVFS
jgi:hypothetical protein